MIKLHPPNIWPARFRIRYVSSASSPFPKTGRFKEIFVRSSLSADFQSGGLRFVRSRGPVIHGGPSERDRRLISKASARLQTWAVRV